MTTRTPLNARRDASSGIGYYNMGCSLLLTGDFTQARAHLDRAIALYDPAAHRPLATGRSQDIGTAILVFRAVALWMLGYPEAALADADHALKHAREIGHAPTLMHALGWTGLVQIECGSDLAAKARADELVLLADEKAALLWKALGTAIQGCVLAPSGDASNAVQLISSGIAAFRSTGAAVGTPWLLSYLARAYAALGQFDDAWCCAGEAMAKAEATRERCTDAEIHWAAGEIALLSPEPDTAKAKAHFEGALAIAREQRAKSWELRAAMSMARLYRDQGKREEARDLLAPVYGWFTEGFDTLDLKEAKALLDALAS